jgi:hypothetical protein
LAPLVRPDQLAISSWFTPTRFCLRALVSFFCCMKILPPGSQISVRAPTTVMFPDFVFPSQFSCAPTTAELCRLLLISTAACFHCCARCRAQDCFLRFGVAAAQAHITGVQLSFFLVKISSVKGYVLIVDLLVNHHSSDFYRWSRQSCLRPDVLLACSPCTQLLFL